MKIIRTVVVACFIAAVIWLFVRVVPSFGIFRAASADPTVLQNGFALVLFKKGKATDALPLNMVKTGLSAVWQGWPLIIIGMMVGYPLGKYARSKFAIKKASKEAIRESRQHAEDAFTSELNADRMLKEVRAIHDEMPRLRKELSEERGKLETMTIIEEDMLRNFADLR